jgi:DNA invertase Pin-like site-specific DNA recombinase
MVASGSSLRAAPNPLKPLAYSYLRMSTEPQLLGDSRRRQLEASRSYAAAHDLQLAEDGELEDIGISAFKGANVTDGALGRFLQGIKSGAVEPGSYLLVESLDRLSRQEPLPALFLFLSIVQAGVNVVTLADGRVFKKDATDLPDLLGTLVTISRANEESQTKSIRGSASWENKRAGAALKKPMTKWCPAWLALSPERTEYLPIPDRVKIVRQIFADVVAGIGLFSIARRMNEAGVPTFSESNGWHQSYIAKILANRAVLGEYQPHARVNGKPVPRGAPIPNYFPAIISEELFFQAQFAKSQRRVSGAGRKGTAFTNLFSGLARCAYCRSPVVFENKGGGRKGGSYLICSGAKRHLGCPSVRWRYRDFEASFLAFVEEVDIQGIVQESAGPTERERIEGQISATRGQLSEVADLMEKAFGMLSSDVAVEFITEKLKGLEKRRTELSEQIADKESELKELRSREARYRSSQEEISELVRKLQAPADGDLFKPRAQIASQLKVLVDTILVASVGDRPRMQKAIDRLRSIPAHGSDDVLAYMEEMAAAPDQTRPYFAVNFRDSNFRLVFPAEDDPLRYEQQITAGDAFSSGLHEFVSQVQ